MTALHLVASQAALPAAEGDGSPAIAQLGDYEGRVIAGQYVVTAQQEAVIHTPRLQLTLADNTGTILGFVWPECRGDIDMPPLRCPVHVIAEVRMHQGQPQLCVQQLHRLPVDQMHDVVRFLIGTPAEDQDAIHSLEQSLSPTLRMFLVRVLMDPQIGSAFLTCRASGRHHHAEHGGLLHHSVENLDLIAAMVRRTLPDDAASVGLAQLGYLFHDIGKIRTVGTDRRPELYHVVCHELHNLLILAPHLAWLRKEAPQLHAGLVYILEYLVTPASARSRPRYFPAEVVAQFDAWSAAAFSNRTLASLVSERRASNTRRQLRPHRG